VSKLKEKFSIPQNKVQPDDRKPVSLKQLAEYVGLSPGTISVVLNNTPRATTIPQDTKDRILDAAKELNYRPHYFARSLRAKQSFTIGVLVSELSGGYCAMILNGIESALSQKGYFYLATSHFHRDDLLEHNPQILLERQVEGIIAIDTQIRFKTNLPVINVSGHENINGVTNVILDHHLAAELGVGHLFDLGHRRIAFIKGQEFSTDTHIRWETIRQSAEKRGLTVDPELVVQLGGDLGTPMLGYMATQKIIASGKPFTALFAFNDISAIGAISAIQEAGWRVPEDVSVLGFDDIYSAPFHNPALTTIRQPLFEMGELAGQTLLKAISKADHWEAEIPNALTVKPELIIRKSTHPIKS
jgi:DNA-binding LacI/PurR family transcriptional regulator